MRNCGIHLPYMRSSYPTSTFPNHYAIATGLYPEAHGIVDNHFNDFALNATFDVGGPTQNEPAWWGGEPIWVTTSSQAKVSAVSYS